MIRWANYSGSSMKQSKANKHLAFNLPELSAFPAPGISAFRLLGFGASKYIVSLIASQLPGFPAEGAMSFEL